MNTVIMAALGWQTVRRFKDIREIQQQRFHQITRSVDGV
jgi:hypothetical protein